ncbi:MAG: FecR domain-containing protein [Clostridia bacterium]|nr:FecR domain-containing protein [Clostridia bacterium]
MKTPLKNRIASFIMSIILSISFISGAFADDYTAQTMKLLRYEGNLEILDPNGDPRFVMENVRFNSGETMITGENSLASVSLDDTKIVTLNQNSRVQFIQNDSHFLLKLQEGELILDVAKKLDENQSLDIQTSTMTVGIRGTIVGVSDYEAFDDLNSEEIRKRVSYLWVLSGIAKIEYTDEDGLRLTFDVPAGSYVVTVDLDGDGLVDIPPEVQEVLPENLPLMYLLYLLSDSDALQRVLQDTGLSASDLFNALGIGVPSPENAPTSTED